MTAPPIIVLGASAGGVEVLRTVVGGLPSDLPAAVFVVMHTPAHGPGALPAILRRKGQLPAAFAEEGTPIKPGRIFVAPGDHHLLIHNQHVELTRGPTENGYRPAVDTTLRSAARAHGPSVIGVILSGALDDGTAGALAVSRAGGTVVVQDPEDALYDGMPRSALAHVRTDHVLPAAEIGPLLARLAKEIDDEAPAPAGSNPTAGNHDVEPEAAPSPFSCPDCQGVLWETFESGIPRFRCRVGHAWSMRSLVAQHGEALESALWTAVRALEERAVLCDRMRRRAEEGGHRVTATHFEERGAEAGKAAALIRRLIVDGQGPVAD